MIARTLILSATLLLGAGLVAAASRTEAVPARESLRDFPLTIAEWRVFNQTELSPDALAVLGVDEYVNRVYRSTAGDVGLYIGFYESQRQGDTIHSPNNCLPGSGWQPVSRSYIDIPATLGDGTEQTISVNRYVIEKGLDRHVVLYWYQSHGRVIANEYRSKIFMVLDAVRLNRTDAALVRVISPVSGSGRAAEDAASSVAVDFVKKTFPLLDKYLPS